MKKSFYVAIATFLAASFVAISTAHAIDMPKRWQKTSECRFVDTRNEATFLCLNKSVEQFVAEAYDPISEGYAKIANSWDHTVSGVPVRQYSIVIYFKNEKGNWIQSRRTAVVFTLKCGGKQQRYVAASKGGKYNQLPWVGLFIKACRR